MADKITFAKDTLEGFLGKLGSGEPVPGGGGAAALSSALGASLIMMVAEHTIGKPKYADFQELNIRVRDEAKGLRDRFAEGIDKDAEAFLKVTGAYGMPRIFSDIQIDRVSAVIEDLRSQGFRVSEIDEDEGMTPELMDEIEAGLKAVRSAAIREACVAAAQAPLSVMEDSVKALRLAKSLMGASNPNLESDILVAAVELDAGLTAAGVNVDVNLPVIAKGDPELAAGLRARADELRRESAELKEQITGSGRKQA